MLRIQTILSTERLWMPIHVHYNYGTVDEELPVSIEESLMFAEEPQSLVITEEHVEHVIEQELIEPESVLLEEEVKDEPNETNTEPVTTEYSTEPVTSKDKAESIINEIKTESVINEIKAESIREIKTESISDIKTESISNIMAESMTSEINTESMTSEINTESISEIKTESMVTIEKEEIKKEKEQLPLTITIGLATNKENGSLSDRSSIESKSKESKTDMLMSDDQVTSEEDLSPINPSIISSSSSFSPITPTSLESPIENQLKSSPTRNSLFRRETNKLNHKRRSLTKKLKNVLVHSNKKIST